MSDIPRVRFGQTIVAGHAAVSKQCGLYVSKAAIASNNVAIADVGLKASKTGVTFSLRKPIPAVLVTKLVRASRKDLKM